LFAWLRGLDAPQVQRRRRARGTCRACGKDLAIIASTGAFWSHACTPTPAIRTIGAPDDGGGA
jgi:hypothetical protein